MLGAPKRHFVYESIIVVRPSFMKKFLRWLSKLNIWPAPREYPRAKSVEEALAQDWKNVGNDMRTAIRKAEDELNNRN